jgi:hypothetical protein
MTNNTIQKVLPAGLYFFGDPCYVLDDQDWLRFCHYFDNFFASSDAVVSDSLIELNEEWNGTIANYTAYGDGEYESDCESFTCFVDSGMIGLVEGSYWEKNNQDRLNELGKVIEFNEPVLFESHDGKFFINGVLVINTN